MASCRVRYITARNCPLFGAITPRFRWLFKPKKPPNHAMLSASISHFLSPGRSHRPHTTQAKNEPYPHVFQGSQQYRMSRDTRVHRKPRLARNWRHRKPRFSRICLWGARGVMQVWACQVVSRDSACRSSRSAVAADPVCDSVSGLRRWPDRLPSSAGGRDPVAELRRWPVSPWPLAEPVAGPGGRSPVAGIR